MFDSLGHLISSGEGKSDDNSANISHVAVKPPPFYTKSPSTWFKQMESQFHLAKISASSTKFHHVLSCLPENIVCELPLDDMVEDYEILKKSIIESLSANKHERIDQALSAVPLGDKRPSAYVTDLKRKFSDIGLTPEAEIIKSRLVSALPSNIRAALIGHENESLDSFAKIADSMMAVIGNSTHPYHVGAIEEGRKFSQYKQHNHAFNSSPRSFQNKTNHSQNLSSSFSRLNIRPFYNDQRPKICNAHIFFAEKARSCRPWCKWPNKPSNILRNGEKTPYQSRSNSPQPKN